MIVQFFDIDHNLYNLFLLQNLKKILIAAMMLLCLLQEKELSL